MTPPRRRLAVAAATLILAGFTTACGAVGQAVDCVSFTQELNKITNEFSSSMGTAATDVKAIDKASQETADKLKALAGKHEGELASALTDMASLFEGIKADDPAAATEAMGKLPDIQAKVTSACS
ncbi:hypothetical protein [Nonomuraea candida]|uniref:hypothetical protein n=1 Tax=Nonomuraea candida TaxID=359159 RepID=UPI0005B98290|nr:hypothetical protein [Nonomuraea candida]